MASIPLPDPPILPTLLSVGDPFSRLSGGARNSLNAVLKLRYDWEKRG